jgi:hypothetical protein
MDIFSPHLPFAELAELADERSTPAPGLVEHLATCKQCKSQLESLKQTIGLMRADTAEDAPRDVLAAVKNYPRRSASREPSLWQRVTASLSFDSLTNAPAFGLRSQATTARQLIYAAQTADIEVRVSPANEDWLIAGQVLGSDCASGDVDLEGDGFSVSAKLNELCEFSFGAVPTGAYKLSVRLPELLIETPWLELGP